MLKLRAPIEIKARTEYPVASEAFYQRMIAGYSLMEAPVSGEDLMHLAATPPEIYVMEGEGITSLVQSNVRNEANLKKVEILNNVLNRIVVSANTSLTYQDRVFITDALYRLGVRDDRRFMNAFYRMAEETRNVNTLINLYLSRGGDLAKRIESLETRTERERTEDTESVERERENFLYERILRRLRTGAIYQIISNFNRSQEPSSVEQNEYAISNQTYTAQHILLSYLRQRTGVGADRLIFRNDNVFEENIENISPETTNVRNELTAAVLMDMLQNIYHAGYERFEQKNNAYYRFEDTFFKSSEQTFTRISRGGEFSTYYNNRTEQELTEQNLLEKSEIELLSGSESGELTDEDIARITETVNAMNVQNERRRREYVRAVESVREHLRSSRGGDGMARTRKDAELALTSPEALREKLLEQERIQTIREREIITRMSGMMPGSSMEVFELVNRYFENPGEFADRRDRIRPAEIGELIYDIRNAQREEPLPSQQTPTENSAVREAPRSVTPGTIRSVSRQDNEERVSLIHRSNETLSEEELNEQLAEMSRNLSREIKRDVVSEVTSETHTVSTREVHNETQHTDTPSTREIEQMIESGVRSRMNAISNEVIGKLERRMNNEKKRRGF